MIATSGFLTALDQIRFRTPLGSLQRSPDSRAGFRGPTSKGEREGRGEREKGREGQAPFLEFLDRPLLLARLSSML